MDTKLEAPQRPNGWRTALIGRHPKRTLVRIVILVGICLAMRAFVLVPIRVEGISMLPTYKDGSIHLINRLAYKLRAPQRGDVVAIRLIAGEHVMYLKRIVGLPGETVAFHDGQLYINGQPMAEPYVKLQGHWESDIGQLGPDQYFVVGDNRDTWFRGHEKGRPTRDYFVGTVLL
ncbi:MAG TPA: signal peptidase I [Candidatus Acidoferrum sp.]|nr:signal peptidase I [Candidatus Acidoferrum sp.]